MRLTQAAAVFQGECHQIAAFNAVEARMTPEELQEFEETFNAGPPRTPCPSMAELIQWHQQALDEVQP
jgi:hypothetical protein